MAWNPSLDTKTQKRNARRNLKTLRNMRGWTQREVAHRVGSTSSHISQIEAGARHPSLLFSKGLARVFRVPVNDFINKRIEVRMEVLAV